MAKTKDLDYYLAQARRIAEHKEAGAEKVARVALAAVLKGGKTSMSKAPSSDKQHILPPIFNKITVLTT